MFLQPNQTNMPVHNRLENAILAKPALHINIIKQLSLFEVLLITATNLRICTDVMLKALYSD